MSAMSELLEDIFLSTPSVWRATHSKRLRRHNQHISIHALRVEGDPSGSHRVGACSAFLSTPSVWRATR